MSAPSNEASTTKIINITGAAATQDGGAKKRRRRTAKQAGGSPASATAPQEPIIPPTMNVIRQMGSAAPTTGPAPAPPLAAPSAQTGGAAAASLQPGHKQKIALLPAKLKNKTRVLLGPKAIPSSPLSKQIAGAQKLGGQTRKQKKFSLRVAAVRRKVASTRKHIHASTALPIDKIRKELVEAKLLKPGSKAPEALIRKIYADYKITTAK
jgi:hypothetical protein